MKRAPVLIIGAGLAGLCTANVLAKRGTPFIVFEKDAGRDVRDQGYRIHLDWQTVETLKRILQPEAFDMFLSLSQPLGSKFTLWNRKKELLASIDTLANDAQKRGRAISRFSLRQLLLAQLDTEVRYAKKFVRYERGNDCVRAVFGDESAAEGAFLIAADGVRSDVTRQFHHEFQAQDTGCIYVIGKLPTSEAHHGLFPPPPFERLGIVLGKDGTLMFLSEQSITHENAGHPERLPYLNDPKDFSIWSLVCRSERLPHSRSTAELSTSQIRDFCLETCRGFHPHLLQMIGESDRATLICSPVLSTRRTSRWKTDGRVTMIGDAVHAMTPLQGKGANRAIQDASRLGELLNKVDVGSSGFTSELGKFEQEMQRSSRAAVRRSYLTMKVAVSSGLGRSIVLNAMRWAARRRHARPANPHLAA